MKPTEQPSEELIVVRYTSVTRGDALYARDKLSMAVYALATGYGTLRSRLFDAYLEFHVLTSDDFPSSLRPDFEWIKRGLTKRQPHSDEGKVRATLRGMRKAKAMEIAVRISNLCDSLIAYVENAEGVGQPAGK